MLLCQTPTPNRTRRLLRLLSVVVARPATVVSACRAALGTNGRVVVLAAAVAHPGALSDGMRTRVFCHHSPPTTHAGTAAEGETSVVDVADGVGSLDLE